MNKFKLSIFRLSLLGLFFLINSCNKEEVNTSGTTDSGSGTISILSVVQAKYKSMVTISTSNGTGNGLITLKSNGVPDHVTPYWGSGSSLYEAPTLTGQTVNPGSLQTQTFSMTMQTNPAEASSKEATTLGPIGMALNGVAIYNDREGGNVPVDSATLLSFDRFGAHSGPGGLYHYHFTGDIIGNDNHNLIGFLRDGFPIYARKDVDGSYPTNLDTNGGHVGVTAEFPTAIYHYHATNIAYMNSRFYVLKAGSYHGAKGAFTF